MAKEKYDEQEGQWRTIGGRRVFIKNGQSLAEAMKASGKFEKSTNKKTEKEDKETISDEEYKKKLIEYNAQIDKENAERAKLYEADRKWSEQLKEQREASKLEKSPSEYSESELDEEIEHSEKMLKEYERRLNKSGLDPKDRERYEDMASRYEQNLDDLKSEKGSRKTNGEVWEKQEDGSYKANKEAMKKDYEERHKKYDEKIKQLANDRVNMTNGDWEASVMAYEQQNADGTYKTMQDIMDDVDDYTNKNLTYSKKGAEALGVTKADLESSKKIHEEQEKTTNETMNDAIRSKARKTNRKTDTAGSEAKDEETFNKIAKFYGYDKLSDDQIRETLDFAEKRHLYHAQEDIDAMRRHLDRKDQGKYKANQEIKKIASEYKDIQNEYARISDELAHKDYGTKEWEKLQDELQATRQLMDKHRNGMYKEFNKTIPYADIQKQASKVAGLNGVEWSDVKINDDADTRGYYPKFKSKDIKDQAGVFGKVLKNAELSTFNSNFTWDETTGEPRYWGSIDLQYQHKDGGSNGMHLMDYEYSPSFGLATVDPDGNINWNGRDLNSVSDYAEYFEKRGYSPEKAKAYAQDIVERRKK